MKISIGLLLVLQVLPLLAGCAPGNPQRCFFISSSQGNDANPGTEERPLRSIASLTGEQKRNATVRLRRGDVFFENIKGFTSCVIEAYGEGDKPVVCGMRVLTNPEAWTRVGDSLWRLDLSADENLAGFPRRLASNKARFTDMGCMYDAGQDSIYGHIVRSVNLLTKDGDLYQTDKWKNDDIDEETFRYLTLRLSHHPRELGHVGFSVYEHGVSAMKGCTIRDIAVVGFGKHGMCGLNGCTVADCELDIIGGSLQTGTPHWVRFGNGIEFWITANPIGQTTVTGCLIARTYDCGSTIQGSGKGVGNPEGIHFIGNRYYRCRQAFEHFLRSDDTDPQYVDCSFTGNVTYRSGDNGFSSPEKRDAHVLSYESSEKFLNISGNEFFDGNYYCGHQKPEGMDGNRVYIYPEQYLVHYHGTKDFPTIFAVSEGSVREFREKWGDESRIEIIEHGSDQDVKLRHLFLNEINYHVHELKFEELMGR